MAFDGYPYLATRVVRAMSHINLLPSGLSESALLEIARQQVLANRLPALLVLAEVHGWQVGEDGDARPCSTTTLYGATVTGKLAPAVACDAASEDVRAREARLTALVAQHAHGFVLAALGKGGRAANPEERGRLAGTRSAGPPRGLRRCTRCGDWKGACLDPSVAETAWIITVHCACDNHNRCARCHELLFERRLNASLYNPKDGHIWHVPGFCGFGHRCPEGS